MTSIKLVSQERGLCIHASQSSEVDVFEIRPFSIWLVTCEHGLHDGVRNVFFPLCSRIHLENNMIEFPAALARSHSAPPGAVCGVTARAAVTR